MLSQLAIDDPRWRAFLGEADGVLPFHHPAWASLLAECYGFPAFVFALEAKGSIRGGLPVLEVRSLLGTRRWVSLPFTDHCPPLALDEDALARLPRGLDEARERAGIDRVDVHADVRAPGGTWVAAVTHTLGLRRDAQEVFASFHRSQVQRGIRKAENGPLVLRRAETESDVADVFYRLHLETRRRQGTPVQPRRFFRLLWRRVIEPGLGFVALAYAGGAPAAAAVFLAWNDTVTYKYGASDPRYLRLRPNHLLFWDAIRRACEEGRRSFDFGRTDLENRGLRDFKSQWGAEELPLRYSSLSDGASERTNGRSAHALGAVIRRTPAWVCRGLGEALYKYAA